MNDSPKELKDILEMLPLDWKSELPVAFFYAKNNASKKNSTISVVSIPYNTTQLACYWFYKPLTQMFKNLEDETLDSCS